ncbi:hypothetical protein DPMN_176794 [Dreissena polymorpha]|uniref:Uncharacterized protein n=1 Tax=Dreissena polymorpha TaxID=45954 RepID=A0A9D4E7K2_DREPO|nr:hypothetical protein DPMN_176794 [Dreissena polymorpha]
MHGPITNPGAPYPHRPHPLPTPDRSFARLRRWRRRRGNDKDRDSPEVQVRDGMLGSVLWIADVRLGLLQGNKQREMPDEMRGRWAHVRGILLAPDGVLVSSEPAEAREQNADLPFMGPRGVR